MRAVDVIRKKRDGHALGPEEIRSFVKAASDKSWPEYQLAALLMAIWIRGMTVEETAYLTRAMADSGTCLDLANLPGPAVDKHSTGGVGDKTSLILAPLAAACGVYVPMMSGRGLGHTGGTLDKLESIPGFRVGLSLDEFRIVLKATGMAMIGQTADVAPADKMLYSLRDVTGTVESIPLITASILSKKIAEGAQALVMDVKVGRGAFMEDEPSARKLAESIVANGTANGLKMEALITSMDAPLGNAIGNALEVIECIEVLKGRGPKDTAELSLELAARMVRLGGMAETQEAAMAKIRKALDSGAGLDKLRACIAQQGGNPRVVDDYSLLPTAPSKQTFTATSSGFITSMDAGLVGRASMALGAGRDRAEDPVDHAVGIVLQKKPGDTVKTGEAIAEIHHRDGHGLSACLDMLQRAIAIGDTTPKLPPLIRHVISRA
ncbi:MAG: thymidine phosphorylase [Gemmataceae bacterium]